MAELLEAALRPLSTSSAVPAGAKVKGGENGGLAYAPPSFPSSSSAASSAGTLLRNLCRSAPTLLAPLAPRLAHLIIAAGSGAAGGGDGGKALGCIPPQQGVRQGKAAARGKAGKAAAAVAEDPMDLGLGTQVYLCVVFNGYVRRR